MSEDNEDEDDSGQLFPQRFSQFKKKIAGSGNSTMLKRIDSQEEYNPNHDDEETFIQIHRRASKDVAHASSRSSSFRGSQPNTSRVSIITNCSSGDSEADEHGHITSLGSMRRSVSVSASENSHSVVTSPAKKNGVTVEVMNDEDGASSRILFDGGLDSDMDEDDGPDLDDI